MILTQVELTLSGRPKLRVGEIERMLLDKVDLEFEGIGGTEGCQTADRYKNGYVVVTNQRFIWIDASAIPSPGRSCHLPMDSIHSIRKHVQYSLNLMNPKVLVEFKVFVDVSSKPTSMQASATFRYLQLRCRGDSPDAFIQHLNAALQAHRQQQEQQQHQQQHQQRLAQQELQQRNHKSTPSSPLHASLQQRQQAAPWGLDSSSSSMFVPGGPAAVGPVSAAMPGSPRLPGAIQRPAVQAVDKEQLEALVEMGFPRPRVLRALLATNSEHMQAALDWILAADGDPSMDEPLRQQEPAVLSRQELLQHLQQQQQQSGSVLQQAGSSILPGWGLGTVGAAAAGPPQAPAGAAVGQVYNTCSAVSSSAHAGAQQQQQPAAAAGVIGVAGIMHREAEKTSKTSANLAVAFRDLDNLMGMAADMVKLAEKFRGVTGPDGTITLNPATIHASHSAPAALDQASSVANNDLAANEQLLLDAETQLQLVAMGIASPVTKASAGARYQQELCRQLADFLSAPLARSGGVMLLPDVYCLFNRARGTELLSPDDLLQACEAFHQVGLPLRLRRFPSGVIVVQGSQFSDAQLCSNIEQHLRRKSEQQRDLMPSSNAPGLGASLRASDLSVAMNLPLTLAKEALLVAETRGFLCRDDGPEGLRFFRNFFKDAQPMAIV